MQYAAEKVIEATLGEYIQGLDQRQVELDTASMFMAVLLMTLIGSVLYGGVILMEKLVVPRDARLG